jgi:hypothetical protein
VVTSIFAPELAPASSSQAEEDEHPRSKTFVMDASEFVGADADESLSGFPDISPIRASMAHPVKAVEQAPLFGAMPSFLDLVEQEREIARFERSMEDLSLNSSTMFRHGQAKEVAPTRRRVVVAGPAVSRAHPPPPLTSFYTEASERVSLLEAADPADREEALARLRLLSEKFKHDPSSVPARLEDHMAWVREQKRREEEESEVWTDVVRGLTSEEQAIYDSVMQSGNPNTVVTDPSVMDTFDMSLKKSDIWRLKPSEWLNDESINLYMKMIQKRGDDSKHRIFCFNSFFYDLLLKSGYEKVARWSKRKDIFSLDMLLFPVHLGNHWCLGIVNMKKKQLEYYDSLGGGNDECFAQMKLYLEGEHLDKKKKPMDWSGWGPNVVNGPKMPRQLNGSDCGVFAAMFAESFSRDVYPSFSQSDMPNLRKLMTVELVKGKFLSRT